MQQSCDTGIWHSNVVKGYCVITNQQLVQLRAQYRYAGTTVLNAPFEPTGQPYGTYWLTAVAVSM